MVTRLSDRPGIPPFNGRVGVIRLSLGRELFNVLPVVTIAMPSSVTCRQDSRLAAAEWFKQCVPNLELNQRLRHYAIFLK